MALEACAARDAYATTPIYNLWIAEGSKPSACAESAAWRGERGRAAGTPFGGNLLRPTGLRAGGIHDQTEPLTIRGLRDEPGETRFRWRSGSAADSVKRFTRV